MIRTIRRGFWLTVGAAVGAGGYRKVTRLARTVSAGHPPAGAGSVTAGSAGVAGPAALLVRGVRASALFARDVREGMRIYRLAGGDAAPGPLRHRASGSGVARSGAARSDAGQDGPATRRRAEDWAFAAGECPDEVKDGR